MSAAWLSTWQDVYLSQSKNLLKQNKSNPENLKVTTGRQVTLEPLCWKTKNVMIFKFIIRNNDIVVLGPGICPKPRQQKHDLPEKREEEFQKIDGFLLLCDGYL